MQVKVKLDPLFRAKTGGQATLLLELTEGATVADALAGLVEHWPDLEPMLNASSALHTFFLNSHIVPRGRKGTVQMKDGDTLYIFEPVAGG
jgi:molybdopterin converting factor small subunit